MSRQRINASLLKALSMPSEGGMTYAALARLVGTRHYTHSITVNVNTLSKGFKAAIKGVAGQKSGYHQVTKKYNKLNNWVPVIRRVILGFSYVGTMGGKLGTYSGYLQRDLAAGRLRVRQKSTNIYIFDLDARTEFYETHIEDLLKSFRKMCYKEWVESNDILADVREAEKQLSLYGEFEGHQVRTVGDEVALRMSRGNKTTQGSSFRHDEASTVATAGIAKILEEEFTHNTRYPGLDYQYMATDLIEEIFDLLQIEWEEEPFYDEKAGTIVMKRVVRGKLDPKHFTEATDKVRIRTEGYIPRILEIVNKQLTNAGIVDPAEAAKFEASPTFMEQAAAAAQYKLLRELMQKNPHHIAKAKIKTKKPKPKPRKDIAKKASRPRKAKVVQRKARKSINKPIHIGSEKGQGKEASTSVAADLARLRQYINRRLPAEVRRNMGRPALINRTGRFSNSVQLLSLQQAQNSIMAKYTYLLRPYQTFENTGRKRWPLAYNPKPLIAKSIRNLALGRIEQKLTVRRV